MSPGFDLSNYEPVEKRLERFWSDHKDGRVETWVEWHDPDFSKVVFGSRVSIADTVVATGFAFEMITQSGVNKTSHVENCETSAIGRALANAGYAPKGARPSREEMAKATADAVTDGDLLAPGEERTSAQAAAIESLQGRLYRGLGEAQGKREFAKLRAKLGAPKSRSLTSSEADIFIASLLEAALTLEAVPS